MIVISANGPETEGAEVLVYNLASSDEVGYNSIKKVFNGTAISNLEEDVLILPGKKILKEKNTLVCSEGMGETLKKTDIGDKCVVFELKGKINTAGHSEKPVEESEINKVLREIFKINPQCIYLCLLNSVKNSVHEKSLRNVIKGAGYKVYCSFEMFS